MGNFVQMKIVNTFNHLSEDNASIGFTETSFLVKTIEKLSTLAETDWD